MTTNLCQSTRYGNANCWLAHINKKRFEVLTAVIMKSTITWDITPCSSFESQPKFRRNIASPSSGQKICQLISRPWRWRRYVPPKRRFALNGLHGVISQKIVVFTNKNRLISLIIEMKTPLPVCAPLMRMEKFGQVLEAPRLATDDSTYSRWLANAACRKPITLLCNICVTLRLPDCGKWNSG
jgi:hypothetical protein